MNPTKRTTTITIDNPIHKEVEVSAGMGGYRTQGGTFPTSSVAVPLGGPGAVSVRQREAMSLGDQIEECRVLLGVNPDAEDVSAAQDRLRQLAEAAKTNELANRVVGLGQSVGEDYEAQQNAFARDRSAQGALLAAVIETIRPSLPALCGPTRLVKLGGVPGPSGVRSLYLKTTGELLESDDAAEYECDPEEAADSFGLLTIFRSLADQLEAQGAKFSPTTGKLIGGRAASTARYDQHAAIVQAATLLIKRGEP